MSSNAKNALILAGLALLGSVGIAGAIQQFADGGMVSVRVDERSPDGDDVNLCIPAALVWVAMPLIPDKAFAHMGREIDTLSPVAQAVCRELAKCPDCLLLSATSPSESVEIQKKGACLVVHVEDGDSEVHVSIPLKTAAYVMRRVERSRPEA